MKEKPKRLAPRKEVVRELFLKSGNQCAFPKCKARIMDSEGEFIGQLCHIEAAEKGGERFNPLQTNDQRRAFANLMLLCYTHHVKTNNVAKYSVETLQEMKRVHEAKFTDVVEKIRSSISDHTEESELLLPVTLAEFNRVLGWDQSAEELAEVLPTIVSFAEKIRMLPIPTRELLAIAITRGKAFGGDLRRHVEVPPAELLHACDLSHSELRDQVKILENRNVARIERDWDTETDEVLFINESFPGWSFIEDLQKFCKGASIPVKQIIVELRFDLLDQLS